VHCFPYSKREGTVGARLKELPPSVKDERMDVILALKKDLKESFIKANLGKVFEVIPEDKEGDFVVGYTENYVKVYSKNGEKNTIKTIVPTGLCHDGLCE
jgi:tRNA A37 methylthiotransferase MiaB